MTIEASLKTSIGELCGGRAYADTAAATTPKPFVTFQQVGGRWMEFLEGGPAQKRNARIQVNVWAASRVEANALMRSIEDMLASDPYFAIPQGSLIARYEDTTRTFGAQQDFSIWWT